MSKSNAPVKWAERKDRLFITLEVVDSSGVKVEFTPGEITVTGTGKCKVGEPAVAFETKLLLSNPIKTAPDSSFKVTGQHIQLLALKAEKGDYWGRLTKEAPKALKQWLGCDWALWVDEDEEATKAAPADFGMGGYGDLSNMMQGLGGPAADSDDEDEPPKADLSDLDG